MTYEKEYPKYMKYLDANRRQKLIDQVNFASQYGDIMCGLGNWIKEEIFSFLYLLIYHSFVGDLLE